MGRGTHAWKRARSIKQFCAPPLALVQKLFVGASADMPLRRLPQRPTIVARRGATINATMPRIF